VFAALGAVYLLWGSTYLAIRFAIETLPPLLMAGTRFLVAGGLLYGFLRLRGAPGPLRGQWRPAAVVGALMLLGGNGSVSVAEGFIASGAAALLVATVPVWIVLLDWLRPGGIRPRTPVLVGVVTGFLGVAVLIGPGELGGGALHPVGAALVLFAALSWAAGSLYSRHARLPASPLMATAMEMLTGGAIMVGCGLALGEGFRVDTAAISGRSVVALGYLIVAGSLVAFSCYIWLLRNVPASVAATYAYVNPLVAVLLGWALASEPLTPRTWTATAIIIGSVAVITAWRRPVAPPVPPPPGRTTPDGEHPVAAGRPANSPVRSRGT
jgi:drug/metabolite transporter (DMT)-like permease